MEVLASIAFASRTQNSNSPLLMWLWTVAIGQASHSNLQKQSKAMIIEDECKRNLQVWLRIGQEFWK